MQMTSTTQTCANALCQNTDGYHELLMGDERIPNGTAIAEWVKARCATAAKVKGSQGGASPKL
jgi:hypothetical protein